MGTSIGKYRGHQIVIERKTTNGVVKESGILEDYSSKYLLVEMVKIQEEHLLTFLKRFDKGTGKT